MRTKRITAIIMSIILSIALLTGCGANSAGTSADNTNTDTAKAASTTSNQTINTVTASSESVTVTYDATDSYFNWKNKEYTTLNLNQGTQTITKSGIYELTGTLKDGSVVVKVDTSSDTGTVYLVLDNANISSSNSAPIYIESAKKVVIIAENGTTNTIYQGSGCVVNSDGEPSAAIFSKTDFTITGSGTLKVTSDYNDGITSKDTLKITGGTIIVKAKSDGIVGKDLLAVKTAKITINAGKDGMRSTNDTDAGKGNVVIEDGTFNITSDNDAIQAYSVLQVAGGTLTLTSGGGYTGIIKADSGFDRGGRGFQTPGTTPGSTISGTSTSASSTSTASATSSDTESESQKCLKASGGIIINGGTFTLSSHEDAVNSKGNLSITGGTFTIKAGDDALHADANLTMSNATLSVQNSNEAIEGKNITVNSGTIKLTSSDDGFNVNDNSGVFTINGGNIYVNSEGDGLDSNGSIKMTSGTVYVDGPTQTGNGAIDYNTAFTITGGTLVATGSSGMAEIPDSSSSQPSILMYYSSTQAAGTPVVLKDSSGNVIVSYTPAKQYTSAAISSPQLKTGQSYTLYSGNTKVVAFALSDKVTYLNESGITTNQSQGPGGRGHMGGMSGKMPGNWQQ